MAESTDGKTWTLLTLAPSVGGADPSGVKTMDGGWVFAVTGAPCEGTPTARQMRPR